MGSAILFIRGDGGRYSQSIPASVRRLKIRSVKTGKIFTKFWRPLNLEKPPASTLRSRLAEAFRLKMRDFL
jgi:hypothetical protein